MAAIRSETITLRCPAGNNIFSDGDFELKGEKIIGCVIREVRLDQEEQTGSMRTVQILDLGIAVLAPPVPKCNYLAASCVSFNLMNFAIDNSIYFAQPVAVGDPRQLPMFALVSLGGNLLGQGNSNDIILTVELTITST